jgi:hypothetical protein
MLTTYRRLDHVRASLAALARNPLAAESELFITSDGPREADREQVMKVREFLQDVSGFRNVHLLFRDQNGRYGNWVARREILAEYGRLVFLEEDCICAPGFLNFINQGLTRHADDDQVFSIAGYSPPISELRTPTIQCARVPSFNPWGFGIWKERDAMVPRSLSPGDFNRLLSDRNFRRKVMASLGAPYFGMLRKVVLGELCAYDIMAMLTVIQNDFVSIFPSQSFVQNTGFDGSGEHCGVTGDYRTDPCQEVDFDLASIPSFQSRQLNLAFAEFFGGTRRNTLKFHSKRLRGRLRIPEA